jgi:hypothetical protein
MEVLSQRESSLERDQRTAFNAMMNTVAECLALMYSSLNVYGQKPNPAVCQTWTGAMINRGVTIDEVKAATMYFVQNTTKLPTPKEFYDEIAASRAEQNAKKLTELAKIEADKNTEAARVELRKMGIDPEGPLTPEVKRKIIEAMTPEARPIMAMFFKVDDSKSTARRVKD